CRFQCWGDISPHHGNEREDSEKSINNAGHRREQFYQECEAIGYARRRKLGQENCGANTNRHTEDQRKSRSNESAIYKWQRAKFQRDRIPDRLRQEYKAKLFPRLRRTPVKLEKQKHRNQDDRRSKNQSHQMSNLIATVTTVRPHVAPGRDLL